MITKKKDSAEKAVRDNRRATRRRYSAEQKIRIVLEGLRGESSIAELCRKEGFNQNLYYRWSKEFLEAGKKRLAGDTATVPRLPISPSMGEERYMESITVISPRNRTFASSCCVAASGRTATVALLAGC